MRQASLFEQDRLTLQGSIELTKQSLLSYGKQYKHWAIAFSGGKDSTALVTVVAHLIETNQIPRPQSLTAIYADTRMELPPLHASAMGVLEEMRSRGFNTKIALAPLDKRFLVYILGRGVPPPNNSSLRYCTRQIKVDPMTKALESVREMLAPDERLLMLTGVRQGESAVRDQRISISCSKNGSECGQGWFQTMTAPQTDTLAPILHWRVCQVWDWLTFEAPALGFPTTAVAEAYGGDEAQEINARTGCIGCPLASKDTALDAVIKQPQWAYLAPLKRLRPIYEQMRLFSNRLQKDGTETKKDGSLVANPGRKGPLTLSARSHFLAEILQIQAEVNVEALFSFRPTISLINPEEESRIRELIALRTFPDGWSGDEPRGDILLPEVYPNGNKQLLLF
ncbi:MAG: phosphoadenosine phosphosulfate reductase family protein [Chroococcidiopsis sp.]